jgi:hypothetical protein
MNPAIGKILIIIGIVISLSGILIYFLPKNFPIGRLPGDIYIKGKNFTFSFPVVTSILLSIALSVVFYLLQRFFRK